MIGPGRCACCEFRDEGERMKGRVPLLRCEDVIDWGEGAGRDSGRDGGEVREDEDEDEDDGFRPCDEEDNRRG